MRVDRWIRKLLPRDEKFLAFFVQDVENLAAASRALIELLEAPSETERFRYVRQIEEIEHKGDEITHSIFRDLGLTFITPLDREDIAGLASSLDNILDNIDRAATCIQLYQITEFDEPIRDLADIIERSVAELRRAIPLMKDLRDPEPIHDACVRVNAFENQADVIFHRALARLFQEEADPIRLIKRRELLAMLESATDRCEDAAVMIENVLVKYA